MPPEGHYTHVNVHPIQHIGSLSDGTATVSSIGVLSCGPFTDDRPVIDDHYNINGVFDGDGQTYQFPNYVCTHSGPTSDFKI
jgi:hypothetical protein